MPSGRQFSREVMTGDTGDGVGGVSPVAALIVLATIRCGVGAAISSAARPQCVQERLKLYILWR